MSLPHDIIELEVKGTSAAAYEALRARWQRGFRDRETGLHVMFVAWDMLMEPAHLTGRTSETPDWELAAIFNEAHLSVLPNGDRSVDIEALYAVGLMANLAPWLLGSHEEWEARSVAYRERYRELLHGCISPDVFREARGSYGLYFRSQSGVAGGY